MKNIDKKQRFFLVGFLILSFAASACLLVLFAREDKNVKTAAVSSFTQGKPSDIQYKVESRQYDGNGAYVISGWAVKPGVTYSFYNYGNDAERSCVYNNMHVGFVDGETVYILPTKLSQRDDVNQLINDGIDYSYCGFTAQLPKNKTGKIENGSLVLIWKNPDGSQELYHL